MVPKQLESILINLSKKYKEITKNEQTTSLSFYKVKTRLFDLVGLFWLKQNLVEKI